jgi:hypothetical protein
MAMNPQYDREQRGSRSSRSQRREPSFSNEGGWRSRDEGNTEYDEPMYAQERESDERNRRGGPRQEYEGGRRAGGSAGAGYEDEQERRFRQQGEYRPSSFDSQRERGSRYNYSDGEFSYSPSSSGGAGHGSSMGSGRDRQRDSRSTGQHSGKGPKGYTRSTERIIEDVSESLERDSDVDASEIEVKCENGVVTLTGTVDSRSAKRAAEECAEATQGVRDVMNHLRVQGEDSSARSKSSESGSSSSTSTTQQQRQGAARHT